MDSEPAYFLIALPTTFLNHSPNSRSCFDQLIRPVCPEVRFQIILQEISQHSLSVSPLRPDIDIMFYDSQIIFKCTGKTTKQTISISQRAEFA